MTAEIRGWMSAGVSERQWNVRLVEGLPGAAEGLILRDPDEI